MLACCQKNVGSLPKNIGRVLVVCQQLLAGCQKLRKPPIRARTETILLAYFQQRNLGLAEVGGQELRREGDQVMSVGTPYGGGCLRIDGNVEKT